MKRDLNNYEQDIHNISKCKKASIIFDKVSSLKNNFFADNPDLFNNLKIEIETQYPLVDKTHIFYNEDEFTGSDLNNWSAYANPALQYAYDLVQYFQEEYDEKNVSSLLKGVVTADQISLIESWMNDWEARRNEDPECEHRYQQWKNRYEEVVRLKTLGKKNSKSKSFGLRTELITQMKDTLSKIDTAIGLYNKDEQLDKLIKILSCDDFTQLSKQDAFYFECQTRQFVYILLQMQRTFKLKLLYKTIGESKLFISSGDEPLTANNISSNKSGFEKLPVKNQDIIDKIFKEIFP